MSIIFGEVQYISAENLLSGLNDGEWGFCEDKYYIRSNVTEEMIEDKKTALSFNDSGESIIKVLSPLAVYVDELGVYRFADGNTRVKAILSLLESNPDFIFDVIPFRVLEDGWTPNDLVRLQIASNDSTEKHATMDLLKRVLIEYDNFIFAKRQENPKIKTKQLQGLANEYLCNTFQKTTAQLNKYLRLAKAPEFVQELVASGQMALETFILVDGKLESDLPQEKVSEVYSKLGELAGDTKITEKHVKQWQESLNPNSGDDDGNKGKGKNKDKITTPVTPEMFTSESNNTFNKLFAISGQSINDPEVKPVATGVVKTSLKTLESMLDILTDDDTLQVFDIVKDVMMRRLSNADYVLERAKIAGMNISEVASKYKKLEKAVSQLYKALYETPVVPSSEECDVIVTDEVVATITEDSLESF